MDGNSLFVVIGELLFVTVDVVGTTRVIFEFDLPKELLFCNNRSGLGNVERVGTTGGGLAFGRLVGMDFFLNNGVKIRCSSKRRMITGCITDDKYERLYRRLSLEFNMADEDVGLVGG